MIIVDDGAVLSDDFAIAECMNNYFTNRYKKMARSLAFSRR